LLLDYLRHADCYYVKNGKPTIEPGNIRLAIRPLRQIYGHTPARDFGPLGFKAVRKAMIDAGLCRSEINRRVGRIVLAFKWAVSEEIVPPSVHQALQAVNGLRRGRADVRESEPVKPVPDALVDTLRPHVSRQVWAMVELQCLAGMRPGEVVTMRTIDVDTLGRVWVYIPETHKYAQSSDMAIRQAEYKQRQIDRVHARFLSALRTRAQVRKLALPALQVNIGANQVNMVEARS
jgi:integrase